MGWPSISIKCDEQTTQHKANARSCRLLPNYDRHLTSMQRNVKVATAQNWITDMTSQQR